MICPNTKSATHCLTELFPIYQNKHWTIRLRDDHTDCRICAQASMKCSSWTIQKKSLSCFEILCLIYFAAFFIIHLVSNFRSFISQVLRVLPAWEFLAWGLDGKSSEVLLSFLPAELLLSKNFLARLQLISFMVGHFSME